MTRLYYFEIRDKYIGEGNIDVPVSYHSLCNARFFMSEDSAQFWCDTYCKDFPDAVLCSFEATNWRREE
jgi:hypothetical protein